MGPFYETVCQETSMKIDRALLQNLKDKNAKRLGEIDAEIKDAEENLGLFNNIKVFRFTSLALSMFLLLHFR